MISSYCANGEDSDGIGSLDKHVSKYLFLLPFRTKLEAIEPTDIRPLDLLLEARSTVTKLYSVLFYTYYLDEYPPGQSSIKGSPKSP